MGNYFFWTVLGIMTGVVVLPILDKKFPKQLKAGVAIGVVAAIGLILYGVAEQTSYWRAKNTPWLSTASERENAKLVDELNILAEQVKEIYSQEDDQALELIEQHLRTQKELMEKPESLGVKPLDHKALQQADMLSESI